MSTKSQPSVSDLQRDFQELIELVTGKRAYSLTADQVERDLFRRLLALGAKLLQLFFVTRAAVRPTTPVLAPNGSELPYHSDKPASYFSIFGKIRFARPYFYKSGYEGVSPLDGSLSLPERCYSDLLRESAECLAVDRPFESGLEVLERFLGLKLSKLALETALQEDAADVLAYYEQKSPPAPRTEGPILVAQADGKGIPMVSHEPASTKAHLGKGEKHVHKKEAIATSLYTIAPYVRTPVDVLKALFRPKEAAGPQSKRPGPTNKKVFATLEGKEVAITRLAEQAAYRQGGHITDRVALTDGAEPLQAQVTSKLEGFTLVLDFMHADEYLWQAGNTLFGETDPQRDVWVEERALSLLSGQALDVIHLLEETTKDEKRTDTQKEVLRQVGGYLQRNLPYMHYDEYLARGWPISTGAVEGTCRHLVKDRMELAGMRWVEKGAQAVLELRAVYENGDWDDYHRFRRQRQHIRLYKTPFPHQPACEFTCLELAA
jgi:hypothetical protein